MKISCYVSMQLYWERDSQRDGVFGQPCACLSDIQGQEVHGQKKNGQKSQDTLVGLLQ